MAYNHTHVYTSNLYSIQSVPIQKLDGLVIRRPGQRCRPSLPTPGLARGWEGGVSAPKRCRLGDAGAMELDITWMETFRTIRGYERWSRD